MDMFSTLLQLDDDVVDWILHVSPTTPGQRDLMRRLLGERNSIEDALSELVAKRLKLSTTYFQEEAARLTALAADMKDTEKRIETAEKVINIVGEALTIAAKVVGFLA
jgi:hypothetical protein